MKTKSNKKKVFVSALAIALIAIMSVGSLAWFSSEDTVTNEFKFASSDDSSDPDDIFSIDVWEYTDDANEDGEADTSESNGATYEDILPGSTYIKEPHVENTGAYDQYVRVTITLSDARAWQEIYGLKGTSVMPLENIVVGFDSKMWESCKGTYDAENDAFVYELYYGTVLESGKDFTIFTDVTIPTSLTREQAAAFEGGFTMDILAEAVQSENVGKNAIEAFKTVEETAE